MYLDLKSRIPVGVADWTNVGTDAMEEAQARTGLSDERLARKIPISAKTWVRWKRRGEIPTHYLPRVAPILGFELIPLEPIRVPVAEGETAPDGQVLVATPDLRESLATVVDLLQRIAETVGRSEGALGRIEQAMRAPEQAPRPARQRKA